MKTRKILQSKLDELISKRLGLRKSILFNKRPMKNKVLVNSLTSVSKQISILEWVLNSESTVDVSASSVESDVLHDVGECNASRQSTDELNKEDVEGTLEKRIDCGSFYCADTDRGQRCNVQCVTCQLTGT